METDDLVDVLERTGLAPYEARAYTALLDAGAAAATDVADASGVPGPRVYDVLRSLSDRGYVELFEAETLRARAHDPGEVLADLRDRADDLEAAAEEVEERWEQPELGDHGASIVTRYRTVIDRARLFVREATTQVHLSARPRDVERLREPLAAAHDRGVTVHLLVQTAVDEEPPPAGAVADVCTEARHRPLPTPFVALVDGQRACFAHHPESFDQYGVLVNDRTHTHVFRWYFRTCLWSDCATIHSDRRSRPPIEYVDVREFIRETGPALAAGVAVTVRVEGIDVATGEERELVGTVAGTRHAGGEPAGDGPLVAGRAMLVVDTGDREVAVGGRDAVLEDVEATRIVVEGMEECEGGAADGDDGTAAAPGGTETVTRD